MPALTQERTSMVTDEQQEQALVKAAFTAIDWSGCTVGWNPVRRPVTTKRRKSNACPARIASQSSTAR
jgi:hypothetical protein